jgi:hypothetical protein
MAGDLTTVVEVRDAVQKICAAIDAGVLQPSEAEMLALAQLAVEYGGPLKHDLLCAVASRCEMGRRALKSVAI